MDEKKDLNGRTQEEYILTILKLQNSYNEIQKKILEETAEVKMLEERKSGTKTK